MNESTDFSEMVVAKIDSGREFETQVYYDRDGDCIEFIASPDDFYAERIDSLVTVYYSRSSGQVIGSLIKGVKSVIAATLEKFPGFKIEVEDGQIVLEHLFTARLWSCADSSCTDNHATVVTYRELRKVASRSGAKAELCLVE